MSFTFGSALTTCIRISSLDPRIKRIKQQEKEAREAKKRAAAPGAPPKKTKQQEEEEKKKAELEAKQKEEAEKVTNNFIFVMYADGDELRLPVRKQRSKRRRLRMLPKRRGGSSVLQRMVWMLRDCMYLFIVLAALLAIS